MRDRDTMKEYWTTIGRGDKANWHIAHIDDEEEFFASGPRLAQAILGAGLQELPPGSAVLDLGCGKGRVARAVAEARPDIRVFGIDVASTMVSKAMTSNGHVLNLSFCVGDGVTLSPYPDDTFDVVYSYIVFQHLPRHVVGQCLSDCARVIKPGGRLVFQVQESLTPMPVDPAWDDFRSIRYYTKEQASALVRAPFRLTALRGGGHNFFVEAVKG